MQLSELFLDNDYPKNESHEKGTINTRTPEKGDNFCEVYKQSYCGQKSVGLKTLLQ